MTACPGSDPGTTACSAQIPHWSQKLDVGTHSLAFAGLRPSRDGQCMRFHALSYACSLLQ